MTTNIPFNATIIGKTPTGSDDEGLSLQLHIPPARNKVIMRFKLTTPSEAAVHAEATIHPMVIKRLLSQVSGHQAVYAVAIYPNDNVPTQGQKPVSVTLKAASRTANRHGYTNISIWHEYTNAHAHTRTQFDRVSLIATLANALDYLGPTPCTEPASD